MKDSATLAEIFNLFFFVATVQFFTLNMSRVNRMSMINSKELLDPVSDPRLEEILMKMIMVMVIMMKMKIMLMIFLLGQ